MSHLEPAEVIRKGDDVLLAELVGGASITEAARAASVGRATAQRRLRDPAFQARLAAARAELVTWLTTALTADGELARQTLRNVCERGISETAKVTAARALLDAGERHRAALDLLARVARLEEHAGIYPIGPLAQEAS